MAFESYSISTDTANATVDLPKLETEITSSSITASFDKLLTDADALEVHFDVALDTSDKTILDGIISGHDGIPVVVPDDPQNVIVDSQQPFAAKVLSDGKKLFRRKHGFGKVISANSTDTLTLSVPYAQAKITKAEIMNSLCGDTVDLTIHDDASGTYTTVPNYQINQFGFDVELCDGMYVDESKYDADLYVGMVIKITYTNNSNSDRRVGVNITLHELV